MKAATSSKTASFSFSFSFSPERCRHCILSGGGGGTGLLFGLFNGVISNNTLKWSSLAVPLSFVYPGRSSLTLISLQLFMTQNQETIEHKHRGVCCSYLINHLSTTSDMCSLGKPSFTDNGCVSCHFKSCRKQFKDCHNDPCNSHVL